MHVTSIYRKIVGSDSHAASRTACVRLHCHDKRHKVYLRGIAGGWNVPPAPFETIGVFAWVRIQEENLACGVDCSRIASARISSRIVPVARNRTAPRTSLNVAAFVSLSSNFTLLIVRIEVVCERRVRLRCDWSGACDRTAIGRTRVPRCLVIGLLLSSCPL